MNSDTDTGGKIANVKNDTNSSQNDEETNKEKNGAGQDEPVINVIGTSNVASSSSRNESESGNSRNTENSPIIKTKNQLDTAQQQNLIRIVTNMFEQQAQLAQQQADILKRISKKINDDPKWKINVDDIISNQSGVEGLKNIYNEEYTILDKADIQRRLEREAVVKLATKSYKGMKQMQYTMEAFLKTQTHSETNTHSTGMHETRTHARNHSDSENGDSSDSDGENGNGESILTSIDLKTMTPANKSNASSNLKRERDDDDDSSDEEDNDNQKASSNTNTSTPRVKRERDESSSDGERDSDGGGDSHNRESILSSIDIQTLAPIRTSIASSNLKRERDDDSSDEEQDDEESMSRSQNIQNTIPTRRRLRRRVKR